jgi:hypothetical protein
MTTLDPDKSVAPEAAAPESLVDEELAREVSRLLEEECRDANHY